MEMTQTNALASNTLQIQHQGMPNINNGFSYPVNRDNSIYATNTNYPQQFSTMPTESNSAMPLNTNSSMLANNSAVTNQWANNYMEPSAQMQQATTTTTTNAAAAATAVGQVAQENNLLNTEAVNDFANVNNEEVEPIARWSWGAFPASRTESLRMVIPLGCMYTPLGQPCHELRYPAISCSVCHAIINPYSTVDLYRRVWTCSLCNSPNSIPMDAAQFTRGMLPLELQPYNTTVEYIIPFIPPSPPTFVFVIDTCVDTVEELAGLKDFLHLTLNKIPSYMNVCFITYGATVQVHQTLYSYDKNTENTNIGDVNNNNNDDDNNNVSNVSPRALVFRGTHEISPKKMEEVIQAEFQMYMGSVVERSEPVRALIDNLECDLWPVPRDHRPLRCTGAALSIAATLLQLTCPNTGSLIAAFISGVCTTGPGMVVDTDRLHMIRGHVDIRDSTETASHYSSSCDFYDELKQRIVAHGHSLNCFIASLDQVGVAEMKQCIQCSGGVVLNAESWLQEPFRISLNRFFATRDINNANNYQYDHNNSDNNNNNNSDNNKNNNEGVLSAGLNATFEVFTSPTWKVQGIIGQCVGTGKKTSSVSENEIGFGGTCEWTTCMLDDTTTFAIYYDVSSTTSASAYSSNQANSTRMTQIVTRYEIGQEKRIRVTTLAHRQVNDAASPELMASFDQETALVLLARQALHKADEMPIFDVLRWLDRTLVRLISRFGKYEVNVPQSLSLSQNFVLFPAFVYHLRRSGYLYVFNSSPDETAMRRLQLLKSNVVNSIVQIQPTLYRYSMNAPPAPVPLDSSAIQRDSVLLLDTFFEVLVHYGSTIAAWKKAGYADLEEYAYFKEFLEIPLEDAQILIRDRYPAPRFIEVSQDDPDARILYNRINPSRSYNSANVQSGYGENEEELIYTDDASLQMFMDHLKKVAVAR